MCENKKSLMIRCFLFCKGCFLEENVIYKDAVAVNDKPLEDKRQSLESCRANCLAHNATYFQWKGPNYIHKAGRNSCLCANEAEVENKVSREDAFVGDTRCDGRYSLCIVLISSPRVNNPFCIRDGGCFLCK